MLNEKLDAGEAGYRVGYSRTKWHFGKPPMRDVDRASWQRDDCGTGDFAT